MAAPCTRAAFAAAEGPASLGAGAGTPLCAAAAAAAAPAVVVAAAAAGGEVEDEPAGAWKWGAAGGSSSMSPGGWGLRELFYKVWGEGGASRATSHHASRGWIGGRALETCVAYKAKWVDRQSGYNESKHPSSHPTPFAPPLTQYRILLW